MLVAVILFAIASLTDMLDGRIARSRNLVTNLGKFLDPIADKMLVISVLIALVQTNRIHAIVTVIIILREFMVTGIRLLASDHGVVIAASNLGKAKTVTQIIAIIWVMLESTLIKIAGLIPTDLGSVIIAIGNIAVFLAVIMTLVSGYDYLKKNLFFLKK
jgi:CDP-diacylglycerol--glycerol-3-phosphate 3-phosphatidyltransferase